MRWIDASVKLPRPHTPMEPHSVLVWSVADRRVCIGQYVGALKEWRIDGCPGPQQVSHWMPLPNTPLGARGRH